MSTRTFFEIALGVLLLVGGLFWLNRREAANAELWHQQLTAAKADVKTKTVIQEKASVHYDTVKVGWLKYRDRVLYDTIRPPTVREKEIIAQADKPVAACDTLKQADTALIHAQAHETKIAEHPPGEPRVGFYGEALYDFVQRAPVGRVGVAVRVLGPVELSAAVQGDLPASGQRDWKVQTLVGVRVRF